MRSINLIPEAEMQEQTKTKAVKLSTILTVLVLVCIAVISGYLVYTTSKLKEQKKLLEASVSDLRTEIQRMADVEINARNLDKKYSVLLAIFNNKQYNSALLEELAARKPAGVSIESLNTREENKLLLSATAGTYSDVAGFLNTLINTTFSGGRRGLQKLFTSVSLTSVDLENNSGLIKFSVDIEFDPEVLKLWQK